MTMKVDGVEVKSTPEIRQAIFNELIQARRTGIPLSAIQEALIEAHLQIALDDARIEELQANNVTLLHSANMNSTINDALVTTNESLGEALTVVADVSQERKVLKKKHSRLKKVCLYATGAIATAAGVFYVFKRS